MIIDTLLDPVTNFGKVTVSTGYTNLDTIIVLSPGNGAKLPNPSSSGPFNLTWYNSTDYSDPSDDPNVEIVRCTDNTLDVLTVIREQEGILKTNKNIPTKTYKMILSPTKKTIDDINIEKVSKVGDTMTGTLNLPVNGLIVGINQLIVSGGNVGIGTTNTQNVKLRIFGNSALNNNSALYWRNFADSGYSIGVYSTSSDDLRVITGGIDNRLTILSGGNVGIGTTNPQYGKLQVDGDVALSLGNGAWKVRLGNQNYGNSVLNVYNGDQGNAISVLDVGTNLGSALFVKYDGTVGIGTTSPVAMLDIVGNTAINDNKIWFRAANDNNHYLIFENLGTGHGNNGLRIHEYGGFRFSTSEGDKVEILQNGNVGIGTTTPSAKLHIGGTPGVDGIKFPDGTIQTTAATGYLSRITMPTPTAYYLGNGTSMSNPANAVDQSSITFAGEGYYTGDGGAGNGVGLLFDFGSSAFRYIVIHFGWRASGVNSGIWIVEHSTDNATYYTLADAPKANPDAAEKFVSVSTISSLRYLRMKVGGGTTSGIVTYLKIYEVAAFK